MVGTRTSGKLRVQQLRLSATFSATVGLQRRRVIAEHLPPNHLHRRKALFQEGVVEFLKRKLVAFQFLVILPQLHDLQLAQRVDEIRRIGGAASGLTQAVGAGLV